MKPQYHQSAPVGSVYHLVAWDLTHEASTEPWTPSGQEFTRWTEDIIPNIFSKHIWEICNFPTDTKESLAYDCTKLKRNAWISLKILKPLFKGAEAQSKWWKEQPRSQITHPPVTSSSPSDPWVSSWPHHITHHSLSGSNSSLTEGRKITQEPGRMIWRDRFKSHHEIRTN